MLTYLSKENMKRFGLGAGILFVVYFIYLLCIGVFTSTCKEAYTPPQLNEQSTDKDKAVILADALTFSVEQELDSFFGWLPNDILLPASFSDNITNYQRGVIYATRPASDVLAKTISRFGTKGTIDSRLVNATSRDFVYGADVWGFWFIYDCEGKYNHGLLLQTAVQKMPVSTI